MAFSPKYPPEEGRTTKEQTFVVAALMTFISMKGDTSYGPEQQGDFAIVERPTPACLFLLPTLPT